MIYILSILFVIIIVSSINLILYKKICQKIKRTKNEISENLSRRLDNPILWLYNQKELEKIKCGDKRRILFVTDYLGVAGGAETRIVSLMNFLSDEGYSIGLLTHTNNFEGFFSKRIANIHCNFLENTANEFIKRLVVEYEFDVVEFHIKDWLFIKKLKLESLSKVCKIGCAIHNKTNCPTSIIEQFSYCIKTHKNIQTFPREFYIGNWIAQDVNNVWEYNNQKRAILISRIDKEKMPTIINFVKFCVSNRLEYDIAGPITGDLLDPEFSNFWKSIDKEKYIGLVQTINFLSDRKNAKKYLFVGGVGQVILESVSLGYPALICPHVKNAYPQCAFINDNNFDYLYENNCVIREIVKKETVADSKEILNDLLIGNISKAVVSELKLSKIKRSNQISKYLSIILKKE